jgi:hypothetical protein
MAQNEPLRRTIEEFQKSTLDWVDWEAERIQEQAWKRARNAGKKLISALFGLGLLILGLQAAVLSLLFLLHERATQFIVRPGVAWPMAGLASGLITVGAFFLIFGLASRLSGQTSQTPPAPRSLIPIRTRKTPPSQKAS